MKLTLRYPRSQAALLFVNCLAAWIVLAQDKTEPQRGQPETLMRQGQLAEAREQLASSIKRNPDAVPNRILLTRVLLLEDNFDEASEQIRRALTLAPENAEALALYGHCLFREGSFSQSETQYAKSLRVNPKQPAAHLGMGRIHLTRLQAARSVESLERAISLAPQEEDVYFFASEAYAALKNYARQAECLAKYLDLKPKFNPERVQNAQALLTFVRSFEGPIATIAEPARKYEMAAQPFYGLMLVEGHVNGQGPYRFLVDSGATSTVLSNQLIDSLKVPVISTAVISCVGGTGRTATRLGKVDKFQVGELEIRNLPVSSFDNQIFAELIDGVLSTADLADFLITLDYPDQKIGLVPRAAAAAKAPSPAITASLETSFRILGNLVLLPVSINQRSPQSFLFDTGAVTSALSKRQAAFLGVREDTPNASVDIQFAGACGITQSVLGVNQVDLSLQSLKTSYAKILAVDLKEISKELRTEVSGILGADFYSKRKVTIDYKNTKLVIE